MRFNGIHLQAVADDDSVVAQLIFQQIGEMCIRDRFNIQFIVDENDEVSVIEVNPRSSRSVPFLSKATGVPMANIATKVMLGRSLKDQGLSLIHISVHRQRERKNRRQPVF